VGVQEADVAAERAGDRATLWDAFVQAGLTNGPAPSPDDPTPVVDAALSFVSRTRSPLCMLPIEDVLGQEEQPNLPGTVSEHPNWRRRLHGEAGTLLDEPHAAARVERLAAERPRQ
jgi:4-alpha-glucanotransferase